MAHCCYSEGGRRCRRSATGNPPLCNPHKIAVAEQVRRDMTGHTPAAGAGVSELFDRVVSGRKINRKVVQEAVGDVAAWWEQYQQQQTQQQQQQTPPQPDPTQPPPWRPWWEPIVNEVKRARAQQPPPDPRIAELKLKRSRARIVLGFAQSDKPTEVELNARRRELARKHHPDRGGSVSKMQEINDAVDVLLAELVT